MTTTSFQDSVAEVLQNTGALDIGDDDSDDEGEVPLLGANATTKTVPSIPAAEKKRMRSQRKSHHQPPMPHRHHRNQTRRQPQAVLRIKKGFLGGGGSSRPNKASSATASSSSAASDGDSRVPMVRSNAEAKAKSLQLPEVQNKIEAEKAEAAKLGNQQNQWMTPDLLQKIAANPLLRKGFMDPRCQAAMAEMQTNPQAAMLKYGDQPEMKAFLQAFMKMMGEHFSKLADKQDEERKANGQPPLPGLDPNQPFGTAAAAAAGVAMTPEQRKAQEVAQKAMADPEVRQIVQEPKIQELLANMQSGKPFELEKAMATDPEVVKKLKKLSEAGLLQMAWQK